ncbi:MAG: hypothetical protein F4106_03525 [Gemmatimonadetes bacterium]|nr:hypothetical protein [Gemmatimonadota bacterium]MXX73209.1 hypothetical protein [Gemmatimonadota bacterium]MYC91874.1 hypothetical protein [Gemmatimonadota bacterium]MYG36927.1 hypothetical protein [Gemmatimonadota bacterium]MYJ17107.1 hypothetical protein [Gemmatimonadota bacterium]
MAETFDWLSGTVSAERIAEMNASSTSRPQAQEFFGIQARNMMRLHGEGFPVSFGTDGGSPWAVHQDLADMLRAGMSPADVIVAATSTSAEFVGAGALGMIGDQRGVPAWGGAGPSGDGRGVAGKSLAAGGRPPPESAARGRRYCRNVSCS